MAALEVFEGIRVPEHAGKPPIGFIVPAGCGVKAAEYLEDRKAVLEKTENDIVETTQRMNAIADKKDFTYKQAEKRLHKLYEIKRNCEASIAAAIKQLQLQAARNAKLKTI